MRQVLQGSISAQVSKLTKGMMLEGVFAINKPTGISSAQVLRDLQKHFDPSALFSKNIKSESNRRDAESHNQRNRRKDKQIKVKLGHGGTLDPLATGVLITGVGSGTKSLSSFLQCIKTYETVVLFGAATDSYDRVGKLVERAPYHHITKEVVQEALGAFRGKFEQLPPLFSALKMDGKPLYEYARSGKPIPREIKKRPVEVLEMELLEWHEGGSHEHIPPTEEVSKAEKKLAKGVWELANVAPGSPTGGSVSPSRKRKMDSDSEDDLVSQRPLPKHGRKAVTNGIRTELEEPPMMSGGLSGPDAPESGTNQVADACSEDGDKGPPAARIRMTVTSGFYVRSLCHDLGAAVGSAAIMVELVRTRQAQFELGQNTLEYEELSKGEQVWGPQVEALLNQWNGNKIDTARQDSFSNNQPDPSNQQQIESQTNATEDLRIDEKSKEAIEAMEQPASVSKLAGQPPLVSTGAVG